MAAGPATECSVKGFAVFNPTELGVTVMSVTVVGNHRVVRAKPLASVTAEDGLGAAPWFAVKLTVTPEMPFWTAS